MKTFKIWDPTMFVVTLGGAVNKLTAKNRVYF